MSGYHVAVVRPSNMLKFKPYSCMCEESVNSNFASNCSHAKHCKLWTATTPSKCPKYAEAKHAPKTKKNQTKKQSQKWQREEKQTWETNLKQTPGANLQPNTKRRKVMRIPRTRSRNKHTSNRSVNQPPFRNRIANIAPISFWVW